MTVAEHTPVDVARDLGEGWCRFVRGAVHGEVHMLPAGSLGIGGEDFAEMNWGMVHGPDDVTDAVRHFGERLRARGLPGVLGVSPGEALMAAPIAEELGLTAEEPWPMMTCSATAYRPVVVRDTGPAPRAARVSDPAALTAACDVMGAGFGLAGWLCGNMLGPRFLEQADAHLFLARLDGVPAATAGTGRVGDFVGVCAVATAPELRRRGAASAAVSAAIEYHRDRGAQLFGLMASEAGVPLYSRLGFATVELTPVWSVEAA
jgi:GNAT superfamily N-acetyltransferase